MGYYAPGDYYLCRNGRILDSIGTAIERGKDGTTREVTRYRCEDCSECPYRAACCRARDPESRKELVVCREFTEYREASLGRITTEEGKLLRVNRSIQAEGAFGQLKHNRKFVRFLTAGNVKVACELIPAGDIPEHPQGHCQAQQRQAGKPHFVSRIPAEFLNFLKTRKSKAENQGPPEASGAWLWFVFGYFGCLWALSLLSNIGKGLLQIFVLLQQPHPVAYRSLMHMTASSTILAILSSVTRIASVARSE